MLTSVPGYMTTLQGQLESLDAYAFDRLNRRGGFELSDLIDCVAYPKSHDVWSPEPLEPTDVMELGEASQTMADMGRRLLDEGTVAVVGLSDSVLSPRWRLSTAAGPGLLRGYESLRLRPDNSLFLEDDGPSFHSCGSGDVIPALIESGELGRFLSEGGRHIVIAAGPVPPRLIGCHVATGAPVTCGVLSRILGHGSVACMHAGFNQLVAPHRFMTELSDDIQWMWDGVLVVDALLDFRTVQWKWHRRKKVLGSRLVIEYERYVDDLTVAFRTQFVRSE